MMEALLFTLLLAVSCQGATQPKKTNVLFIAVDDLNPSIHSFGHPTITPNLDKFQTLGTQFQHAYVSVAICSPSRTAFLTGLRPDQTQVWTIGPYFRDMAFGKGMDITTLPQIFRNNGYNVTGGGKIWHPGTPSGGLSKSEGGGDMCPEYKDGNCLWDTPSKLGSWTEPYWFCDQFTNDTVQSPAMQNWDCAKDSWPSCGTGCVQPQSCIECFEQAHSWGNNSFAYFGADCPSECYPESLIATHAIESLKYHAANPDQPFFLAVGFKRPHLTYKAPKSYFDMYDIEDIELPVQATFPESVPPIAYFHNCMRGFADVAPYGINETCDSVTGGCHEYISNATTVKMLRLAYYAAVSFTDHFVGQVMDALEETGLADNTVVTFLGDHGYQNGQKGEWCKCTTFDLATRTPMFVIPPQGDDSYKRGHIESTVVESIDLLPTIAEITGVVVDPNTNYAGESLVPLLKKDEQTRNKTWALSQWPRRPSCITHHSCSDGGGDPSTLSPDQAIMGYTLRTDEWRYAAWFKFDWNNTVPFWNDIQARELYTHKGDTGDYMSGETFENVNLAEDPGHASVVAQLHEQLVEIVKSNSLIPPVLN